jgi:hypothetical protein
MPTAGIFCAIVRVSDEEDPLERHTEERIVKIPLPVTLIRQIDEAIVSGLGGYSTRTEFFRDAAEGLLLELKYEPAPAEPIVRREPVPVPTPSVRTSGEDGNAMRPTPDADDAGRRFDVTPFEDLSATALHLAGDGEPLADGEAEVDDEPLFGMHNRDFPSLWVAFRLAERAASGPVPYEPFVQRATEEAWEYAEALRGLAESGGQKLTALFPTNRAKPQSAADAFKAFAVGSVINGNDRRLRAEGPLFSWRVCQAKRSPAGDLLIGLTSDGWRLLQGLDGISLQLPHAPELARTFLEHLRRHAPGDWWGLRAVVAAVADQPNRLELVETFQRERPDWGSNVAATNAQGYVARAREWGLVQPKQIGGRYTLTEFGTEYLTEITNDVTTNN